MKPSYCLLCLVFAFIACTTASHDPNTGSGGAPVAGHGGNGGGGGSSGGGGGSGGTAATDAGGVLCGKTRCPIGQMCCAGCNPGEASCGTACPGYQCPDVSQPVRCGSTTCPAGQRCCDHCIGSCVSAVSGAFCADDQDPMHGCTDAAAGMCAQPSESCLTTPCCAGLECCSGVPIPQGEARCSGSVGGCPKSDYRLKAGFSAVESDAVLDGLLALPLSKWHYKSEPAEVQHIGPMAQDFKATFGVGADDEHIFQVDADGVSYAAIQALARRIATLSAQQEALTRDNAALREQLQRLENRKDCR